MGTVLYSETRGHERAHCASSCSAVGDENTTVQNNVDKLTSRFNSPVLTNKLVTAKRSSCAGFQPGERL